MRTTTHNGRVRSDGTAYNPKHNDRDYNLEKSDNIDPERTVDNKHWHWCQGTNPEMSFKDAEFLYYDLYLSQSLDAQNQRHIKNRHPERVIDMEQYIKNPRTCPEETILQIGKAGDTVDPKTLQKVTEEYLSWHQKTYPQCKLLSCAIHVDEATPHVHMRRVWTANDKDGLLTVSQTKALAEMGIQRPDPGKRESRYNNAKVTYTRQCRDKFNDLCIEHGLDINLVPQEPSKSGLTQLEYQTQQESQRLADLQQQLEAQRAEIQRLQEAQDYMTEKAKKVKQGLEEASKRMQEYKAKTAELGSISKQLEAETAELGKVLELKEKASRIHEPGALEKAIFQREKVTYDSEMLGYIKEIPKRVQDELAEVNRKLREVADREHAVELKESEINPLHKELDDETWRLKTLIRDQELLIEKKAKQLLNKRLDRLEDFCKSVTYKDGSTVFDHFEQHEKEIHHDRGISR